jgi:hypothetical protein
MLAAAQRALARGDRVLRTAELRELAKCIHRHLDVHERHISRLTNNDLDDAEAWATTRIGAAYALLTPVVGTDDHLEVLDDALDRIGQHAINPRFATCTTSAPDTARLGVEAFVRFTDQDAAVRWTQLAADTGDTNAMVIHGVMLKEPESEGDLAEAEQWYRRAAHAGNTDAMYNLALLLIARKGEGDLAEAEQWFRRAARDGNTDAMVYLGVRLHTRKGEGDLAEAEQWYRRAAHAGNTTAMYSLAVLLHERGDEGDLAEAEQWWASAGVAPRARQAATVRRDVPHLPLA